MKNIKFVVKRTKDGMETLVIAREVLHSGEG